MEFKLFDSFEDMKRVLDHKKPRLVRAGQKNICIVLIDDDLNAFENECPHMGESLHKGHINHLNEIICPLHSYRFNLKTGDTTQSCSSLKKLEVIQEEKILIIL